MFRVIIVLSISLLFMIQAQSAVSGVFTEIKKESREVKNDVSNTAGKIGSEVRRGVSTIGNNIKKDTKRTKKQVHGVFENQKRK